VHDPGLQAVALAVVHQPLQDPGGDDAAAAHDDRAGPGLEKLVHVLVRLVGVDDVVVVAVPLAELLEVGQEAQARVADREVHEPGAVGDPLGRAGAGRRGEDREVAALVAAAHHPRHPLGDHLRVADPGRLPLQAGEHVTGARRPVVGEDRLTEHVQERAQRPVPPGFREGVGREAPDVVRPRRRVRADPLRPGNLRHPGQVLVRLPGVVDVRQHPDLIGRHARDAQVVDRHERADAAADGHERHVVHRYPGPRHQLVGPDGAVDEFGRQVTHAANSVRAHLNPR
jgi:hypothetical protein